MPSISLSKYFFPFISALLQSFFSFLALSLQYYHQCQYTPFKRFKIAALKLQWWSQPHPPVVGINFGNSFASIAVFTNVDDAVDISL